MGTRKPSEHDTLRRLAEAIADGKAVDWSALERSPELSQALRNLREIENISALYQSAGMLAGDAAQGALEAAQADLPEPNTPRATLRRWGSHDLLERIGQGSFGDVYRAHDASLQREVAIKLLNGKRAGNPAATERLLDEARRLARVRHANVITVHSVEAHDGAWGIRTELLEGRTLEECLQAHGPYSAAEAALIGIELCGALAAVHAQDIVHGDIKTTNVIREDGGRIVLTDFGSAREARASSGHHQTATPLVTAPEVLGGQPPRPTADLYQLGVLLYRLVTGRYPIESADLDGLRAKHQAGAAVGLRDRRPDLPAAFIRLVARATAADPHQRFQSAGELEEALQAILAPRAPRTPVAAGRRRRLAALTVSLAILTAILWYGGLGERLLGRTLRLDATLYRVDAGAHRTTELDRREPLRPGDALQLALESREDVHVYVFNEGDSEPGIVNTLFPDPDLNVRNPVAGGIVHLLPAQSSAEATWEVSGSSAVERLLIVASREPLPELEGRIAFARYEPSTPGRFQIDPDKLDALGTRSIELHKNTNRAPVTALAYLETLLFSKASQGHVWYELVELECDSPGLDVSHRKRSATQGR